MPIATRSEHAIREITLELPPGFFPGPSPSKNHKQLALHIPRHPVAEANNSPLSPLTPLTPSCGQPSPTFSEATQYDQGPQAVLPHPFLQRVYQKPYLLADWRWQTTGDSLRLYRAPSREPSVYSPESHAASSTRATTPVLQEERRSVPAVSPSKTKGKGKAKSRK
ncbi:hypothetical protein MKEN_00860000 [Mycena kentingensis (nom. inval.)]|nr:hypothetical protein MKEN_00860000 [Mycena kentingensis (nom. inval.)]